MVLLQISRGWCIGYTFPSQGKDGGFDSRTPLIFMGRNHETSGNRPERRGRFSEFFKKGRAGSREQSPEHLSVVFLSKEGSGTKEAKNPSAVAMAMAQRSRQEMARIFMLLHPEKEVESFVFDDIALNREAASVDAILGGTLSAEVEEEIGNDRAKDAGKDFLTAIGKADLFKPAIEGLGDQAASYNPPERIKHMAQVAEQVAQRKGITDIAQVFQKDSLYKELIREAFTPAEYIDPHITTAHSLNEESVTELFLPIERRELINQAIQVGRQLGREISPDDKLFQRTIEEALPLVIQRPSFQQKVAFMIKEGRRVQFTIAKYLVERFWEDEGMAQLSPELREEIETYAQ